MCPPEGRAPRKKGLPGPLDPFSRLSEERFLPVFERLPVSLWVVDRDLRLRLARGVALPEPLATQLVGATEAEHKRALAGETVRFECELDGCFVRGYLEPLCEGERVAGVLGCALDASAERSARSALQRSRETVALTQAAAHAGSWDHDLAAGTVVWSEELFRLCGVRAEAHAPRPDSLASFVHRDDRGSFESGLEAAERSGEPFSIDTRLIAADGTERWVEHRGRFAYGARRKPLRVLGTVLDISARKHFERDLMRQAHYDPLTQLPNKQLLHERLAEALARARRDGSRVAVLFADLDRFKTINDTLGHAVGDELLRAARDRILRVVGETDIVARRGSDEFVVVQTGIGSADEAARTAQMLVDAFERRFDVDGRDLYSSVSVGIGLFPDDGSGVEEIVRAAEAALARAKSFGGNGLRFYSAPVHQRAIDRLTLEGDLRRAVEREEFTLYYQPVVGTGAAFVGVEALLRWQHPTLGAMPPNEFIPLCEEIGLIAPLGRWVVRAALAQMGEWAAHNVDPGRLALNLSARQFLEPDLARFIAEALAQSGFPPERLELEITESAVMQDLAGAKRAVAEVKALGVNFALDDFGTGYSALSYLKHFPVDALKIDRTFVRDLPGDRGDAAIVSAIVALGHALRLRVVAEGVESAAQAALVRRLGCDEQQGYYYAEPLAPDELETLLRTRRLGLRRTASV